MLASLREDLLRVPEVVLGRCMEVRSGETVLVLGFGRDRLELTR